MSDQDIASIMYPTMNRGEPAKAPAVDANQSAAEAMYGAGVKKDAYVSPFDQKPQAPEVKQPGEQKPATEAKPAVDPAAVKQAADALVKDLALDAADPMAGEFSTAAAELGLNKDQAKRLVDMNAKHSESYWKKTWDGWYEESKKLPSADIDGARQFVRQYGDPGLTKLLNDYKLGDHPAIIKAFARAAKGK